MKILQIRMHNITILIKEQPITFDSAISCSLRCLREVTEVGVAEV